MFLLAAVVVVNVHGFAPKKKKRLEPWWRFEAQWQKKTRFIFFTLVSPGVRSLLDFSFFSPPTLGSGFILIVCPRVSTRLHWCLSGEKSGSLAVESSMASGS
jgi:hypothetical protein